MTEQQPPTEIAGQLYRAETDDRLGLTLSDNDGAQRTVPVRVCGAPEPIDTHGPSAQGEYGQFRLPIKCERDGDLCSSQHVTVLSRPDGSYIRPGANFFLDGERERAKRYALERIERADE
jgi:hypothetical protein